MNRSELVEVPVRRWAEAAGQAIGSSFLRLYAMLYPGEAMLKTMNGSFKSLEQHHRSHFHLHPYIYPHIYLHINPLRPHTLLTPMTKSPHPQHLHHLLLTHPQRLLRQEPPQPLRARRRGQTALIRPNTLAPHPPPRSPPSGSARHHQVHWCH